MPNQSVHVGMEVCGNLGYHYEIPETKDYSMLGSIIQAVRPIYGNYGICLTFRSQSSHTTTSRPKYMSYNLNSFDGEYIGDYIGE